MGHSALGFALARDNADGSLDTGFSGDGRQTTDFGGADSANGVAIQGDGNIVAVGLGLGTNYSIDFALARYLWGLSGALRASFSIRPDGCCRRPWRQA